MLQQTIQLMGGRATLTSYILDDSPELLAGKPRPAVLICPGGAYLFCSDREAEPVALAFAARGYHAFVLRYHTYFLPGESMRILEADDLPIRPASLYPQPLRDIGHAILMIRQHAAEWHVDADQIVLCGFSAGGHNVGMYATHYHRPVLIEYFGVEPAQLRPKAVIGAYMVTDFGNVWRAAKRQGGETRVALGAMNVAYLGELEPSEAQIQAVNPARFVSGETPPMFLWATADDQVVPASCTLEMANALITSHVPVEVHLFPHGVHGLGLATVTTASQSEHVVPGVSRWFQLAIDWLAERIQMPV